MADPVLPLPRMQPASSPILTAGGIVLAIGALYFGRDIFIPFALAILLSFALTPVFNWLRRLKLPRIAAVLVAVTLACIIIGGIGFVVGTQLVQLANNLPTYQTTIAEKVRSLQQSSTGGGLVENVTTAIEGLSKEFSGGKPSGEKPAGASGSMLGGSNPQEPVTVRLEPSRARPLEVIQTIVGPLLAPLATAGLVIIFVIFVLLEREDLRDRFIKLVGAGDLQKSTQAINDAAARVSRYLIMQLVVNLTYGIPIGLALYVIGVPNAVLWGLLAAVLRFIPYLGPFLAALFPIALAVAVDPGWTMLFWVVALFLTAELISNNVVEPWLYGSSTGLSSLAIIMAAIFWTSLWGPVGLFLATPLTVCLVVIGRYVPQLEFLGILLGSDPVLAPEERLYQRLLAGNLEEAVEIAEDYVDEHSSREFYDNVAIPTLRLAENDRQRSTTDTNYRRLVASTAISVVREVEDHIREKDPSTAAPSEKAGEPRVLSGSEGNLPSVLCLAGRTELDHAAAEMLSQVLAERGIGTRILPPIAVSEGALGQLDLNGVRIVCLSYLHPQPQVYARYICRRVRRRAPHVKLVVCYWNPGPGASQAGDAAKQMAADAVFSSLEACMNQVEAWISHPISLTGTPFVLLDLEQDRVAALSKLGLSSAADRRFEDVSRTTAQAFDVPIALVSLIDQVRHLRSEPRDASLDANHTGQPAHESLDAHVVAAGEVLVTEDATEDARFADDPLVLEKGIRFYAGAPLRTSSGVVVGALCLIDTKPREFPEDDRKRLQEVADGLMVELERRAMASANP